MKLLCLLLTVLVYMEGSVEAGMNNIYCHPSEVTFIEAYNICNSRNQVIVEPRTKQDLEMIVSTCGGYPRRWYHTGARRYRFLPGEPFLYPDGTELPSNLWSPGEPQDKDFTEIRPDNKLINDIYFKRQYLYAACMDKN